MGDMADFYLGLDGPEDYLGRGGYRKRHRTPTTKTCKRCGETGFHWEKQKYTGAWRLFKGGVLHSCSESNKE